MSINTILIIAILVMSALLLVFMYLNARGKRELILDEEYKTLDQVLEGVKIEMVETIKEDFTLGCTDEEAEKLAKRKARINEALKNCIYGIDNAKILVIDLIRVFIDENVLDENVDEMLGLTEDSEPADNVMFEILMYKYKKRYGREAFSKWVDKYDLIRSRESYDARSDRERSYYITVDDLQNSYMQENYELTMDEKRDILSIIVYQLYKGFGLIDTLREMNINGINMGTSGSIMDATKSEMKANNGVWVYLRGKYIHLRFMNYGSEKELKRIIQLLIRYNNPGALTVKRGYLVNTMYDKSRVLAIRPPASEYWAIFIRKFSQNPDDFKPERLLDRDGTRSGKLIIDYLSWIMLGEVTTAVTGRQGSGKTTLMSSMMRFIDPRYNIRVLEMAPELYLRELYPSRNILSVQETTTVSAEELQDALKKSDAAVSIVGEVATDAVAARMIQMGMTASKFTIFSHHANTPKDLVITLRNSLAAAAGFDQMSIAEKQVTDVVKLDVHLEFTADGMRYIERVSEIIQLEENVPYPDLKEHSMDEVTREYYTRSTDRVSFKSRDILRFNMDKKVYETAMRMSPMMEKHIMNNLVEENRNDFIAFTLKNWGVRGEDDEYEENLLLEGETVEDALERIGAQAKTNDEKTGIDGTETTNNEETIIGENTDEHDNGVTDLVDDYISGVEELRHKEEEQEIMSLADEFTIGLFDDLD